MTPALEKLRDELFTKGSYSSFCDGFEAAITALEQAAGEWDEQAALATWSEGNKGTWMRGARAQFEADKARIGLAEFNAATTTREAMHERIAELEARLAESEQNFKALHFSKQECEKKLASAEFSLADQDKKRRELDKTRMLLNEHLARAEAERDKFKMLYESEEAGFYTELEATRARVRELEAKVKSLEGIIVRHKRSTK